MRFVYGSLKKRDFRENATGGGGPDLGFVWCCRVGFVAVVSRGVGERAGACVPAFPGGWAPFTEGCESFLRVMRIPFPRGGNLLPRDVDLFSG